MIWYAKEEKKEPEPELRLERADVNGRMVLDILVQNILKGKLLPPDIDPTDLPQALDGVSLDFGGFPPGDNSLKTGQIVTYNDLAVEVLDIISLPCQTFYTIEFHYKG